MALRGFAGVASKGVRLLYGIFLWGFYDMVYLGVVRYVDCVAILGLELYVFAFVCGLYIVGGVRRRIRGDGVGVDNYGRAIEKDVRVGRFLGVLVGHFVESRSVVGV